MARYIDADELLNRLPDDLPYKASVKRVLIQAPTADVAPREKIAQEVISDIKKVIHTHARYPHLMGIDNYITLNVVDALLNDYVDKYSNSKE